MIKIETKNGNCTVGISGSLSTLCSDTMIIIRSIYNGIKEEDKEAAETYKKMIVKEIEMAFKSDDEIHEKAKDFINEFLSGHDMPDLLYALSSLLKENEDED